MSSSPLPVRMRLDPPSAPTMVKPILPRHELPASGPQPAQASNVDQTTDDAPQPRRRGRKPGPLSRSAREAQRKLNHSIIEKARRTKINEALSALRQLVPADYGKRRDKDSGDENDDDDEDDDGDDGDGEYGAPRRKTAVTNKKGATGKKEEKEFKLEVLERTVAYLQDLTDRHEDLQRENEQLLGMRRCSCQEETLGQSTSRKRSHSGSETAPGDTDTELATDERPSKRHEPLPPISSWLPLSPESIRHATDIPQGSRHTTVAPPFPSYLPTPPSSALFRPSQTPVSPLSSTSTKGSYIPSLSLGPTALPLPSLITQLGPASNKRRQSVSHSPLSQTSSILDSKPYSQSQRPDTSPASPSHTREDETAASLLLTMRLLRSPTSPRHAPTTSPLLHTSSIGSRRPSISGRTAPAPPPSPRLPRPERLPAPISGAQKKTELEYVPSSRPAQVETPGSLLGLTGHRSRNGL